MDLDQNGFDLSQPSIHSNVVRKLLMLKCGPTSRGTFGIEESCTIVVNKGTCSPFSYLTSHGGRLMKCDLIYGLGLTSSNMIRLESSKSCEKVLQKILGISWDENVAGYLPRVFCHVNRKCRGYVLDKPLLTALMEGSSPKERVIFKKWLEDNRKIRSIILASMSNDIQKQYDRLDDVPSTMPSMKEVYALPNRHIRYAATKVFLGAKMAKGSSVQSHGMKILSLVEKLENLKAGLHNNMYIEVILQSFPPFYDPFLINYNMI
ncbi:UNVERIFIED_CONTAM: hypothetical protein Sindi_1825300, partial [Sesamum indicum]